MKKSIPFILTVLILISCLCLNSFAAQISPSTWAATDGLGRTLSLNDTTGDVKDEKIVAMFYWIWHYPWCADYEPLNNAEMLRDCPDAQNDWDNPYWTNYIDGRPYFWDEPLYGYYSDLDEYVLRKHAELLADAGIDVIFFDTTNDALLFEDGYETLFKVWEEAKKDGVNVPKISFMLNFWGGDNLHTEITSLYDNIYSKWRYKDLWFIYENKPMLLGSSSVLNILDAKENKIFDFFTFRYCTPTYFKDKTLDVENTWSWCSVYPQTLNGVGVKGIEQIAVSVAQNATDTELAAMNANNGKIHGRSYASGDYSYSYTYAGKEITVDANIENSLLYGRNFQQQWDYAIEKDPKIVFVTGFNEWIAGRFIEWEGTECAFPDQFSPEYSRDIEPSSGVLKDHYYYQLVENVRRFKGTASPQNTSGSKTIDINGKLSQWNSVLPEYNHYTDSTYTRNHSGWKGTYYTNDTMRNDIVSAKVAYDSENIYFYVRTEDKLTSPTDNAWMRLFIDTDTTGLTPNWESFEYVINRSSPTQDSVTVERSIGGWSFEECGKGSYTVNGNVLQLSVPRSALGLDECEDVCFNFKWSDNMQQDGEITDFYKNGDVAPGGRFTFVYDSNADGNNQSQQTSGQQTGLKYFRQIKECVTNLFVYLRKLISHLLQVD